MIKTFLGLLPKAKYLYWGRIQRDPKSRLQRIVYHRSHFLKFGSFTKRNKFYAQGANKKLTKNITNRGEISVGACKISNQILDFLHNIDKFCYNVSK